MNYESCGSQKWTGWKARNAAAGENQNRAHLSDRTGEYNFP